MDDQRHVMPMKCSQGLQQAMNRGAEVVQRLDNDGIDPGLFNAQYMTRMARIALMPPKAMRCRPSETL